MAAGRTLEAHLICMWSTNLKITKFSEESEGEEQMTAQGIRDRWGRFVGNKIIEELLVKKAYAA
eukprot:838153-Karenia_brevis.AAC.1